jgi:site-specific recombinase XerC
MSRPGSSLVLLPVHLKLLPDELLSSWLIRLAHAHGQKLQTFCAQLFGRDKAIWNRDIDRLAPDWLVAKLSEVTATPIERIAAATLKSYGGYLYEHHQPNGNTRWILPLGVYHRTHRNSGLLCCPECLAEDVVPYFRRSWRLALKVACTKHKSWLIDCCPSCNSPIEPHRSDMHSKEYFPILNQLVYCWHCGGDLRMLKNKTQPNTSVLQFQQSLNQTLELGYTDWAGNRSMYSVLYFDGLRALIAGLTSKRSIQRMVQQGRSDELTRCAWPRPGFEFATLEDRKSLVAWLSKLLHDWPKHLRALIHEAKLRYADLKGDSKTRPYWVESVIKDEAGGGFAAISKDEAVSITYAVEKQYGQFSLDKARELSGRDLGNYVPKRSPVADDVYEDLLTALDHQIAGTLNERKRASLIRDKIMFAAGRVLELSEKELCELTLDQLYHSVTSIERAQFSEVAHTRAQVRAWIEWYWNVIRQSSSVPNIFLSLNTGRVLTHRAISYRFRQAILAANMNRSIPSYASWSLIAK